MKTLVTLLGTAPGTVTATYYALGEQGYDLPDRVVVVATESRETDECLKMIRRKFRRPTADEPPGPDLEAVLVPIADLEDEESTRTFQARVAEVLRQERERPDNEVWLSIAGGRKSMAALAAMAAQFIGVQRMFHLYVSPDLERYGDINQLLLEPEWQQRSLHPAQEDYTLVEVPFFEVGVERETLHLLLRGKPDAFVHQVVQAKPALLAKLPDETIRAYWDHVFQEYGSPPQYEELTVRIGPRPSPEEDFPVLAHGEGVGDLHSTFVPLFDPADVEASIKAIGGISPDVEAALKLEDLGRKLFNGLFSGSLLRAFYRAQGRAESLGRRLRLRLRLDPQARLGDLPLQQLPWELLHDGERFLGLQREISIVRHLETERPAGVVPVEGCLRVLIAAASPQGPRDISEPEREELRQLYYGVQPLALRLAVEGLDDPPRTFGELEAALAKVRPHVLYFTGHGKPGGLVFEDPGGNADVHSADEVASLLVGQGVRLVVLNTCHGANAPTPGRLSVAEALVEAGVPAVVAMQSAILTGTRWYHPAVRFAHVFFFQLALGRPVDACVTEARIAMAKNWPRLPQWALPVCFLRTGDGRLFEVAV